MSDTHPGQGTLYKILLPTEWDRFEAEGVFAGSPLDLADGYVHCSSRAQVAATAARFFGSDPALVVLELDGAALGDAVRWEGGTDGGVYPHVYRPLRGDDVTAVRRVAGAAAVDEVLSPPRR